MLLNLLCEGCSCTCPVMECWFVQEKPGRGGGLTGATTQEKSLLHIRTDKQSEAAGSQSDATDIDPSRVYAITGQFNMNPKLLGTNICLVPSLS